MLPCHLAKWDTSGQWNIQTGLYIPGIIALTATRVQGVTQCR